MIDAKELRELEARATKGPWMHGDWSGQCHENHPHGRGHCNYQYTPNLAEDEEGYASGYISSGIDPISIIVTTDEYGKMDFVDARFIVAMRNSLIPLLDRLEKLEAFREAYDYWDREAFYPFKDTFFKPGIKLKEARAALDQKEHGV